jgi:hypothetical protein
MAGAVSARHLADGIHSVIVCANSAAPSGGGSKPHETGAASDTSDNHMADEELDTDDHDSDSDCPPPLIEADEDDDDGHPVCLTARMVWGLAMTIRPLAGVDYGYGAWLPVSQRAAESAWWL